MPKSKRNRMISLTRTDKKYDTKDRLIEEVQQCCEEYGSAWVFSVQNMRNAKLKEVRQLWKSSRFFFGKNKVMAVALGKTPDQEYRTGMHKLAERLVGNVGLLFTNKPVDEVKRWFGRYGEEDYARSGFLATNTVRVSEGPLKQFSHALEPNLRQLGLPTSLVKGIVTLDHDHVICKEGDRLTPEQARLLKLFEIPMATFHLALLGVWTEDEYVSLEGMEE